MALKFHNLDQSFDEGLKISRLNLENEQEDMPTHPNLYSRNDFDKKENPNQASFLQKFLWDFKWLEGSM